MRVDDAESQIREILVVATGRIPNDEVADAVFLVSLILNDYLFVVLNKIGGLI